MDSLKVKIVDIFSYISANEVSLKTLEDVFLKSLNKKEDDIYSVSFETKNLIFTQHQKLALSSTELSSKKKVFILKDNIVAAIITYVEL